MNIVALFVLSLLISLLAAFVLAQDTGVVTQLQQAGAVGDAQSTPVSTGGGTFAQCVGGDITKLTGDVTKCLVHKDLFEKYWRQEGLDQLGVDLLFVLTVAQFESGCKSKFAGDTVKEGGGILQATNDCKADPAKTKCHSLEDEIMWGVKELTKNAKDVQRYGLKGHEANWGILMAYNRGSNVVKRAADKMKTGMPIADAFQEACGDVFGKAGAGPLARSLCDRDTDFYGKRVMRDYHCNGYGYDSVCDGGKNCGFYAGCFVGNPDIPIHYVGERWPKYVRACEKIGGTIVDQGGPIVAPPAEAAAPAEAGEEEIPPGYRPPHPYFSVPYSVNPSFSVDVPYDFSIYDKISTDLRGLERCLDDTECIITGVTALEQADIGLNWIVQYGGNVISQDSDGVPENFVWESYCEKPSVHAVNSLAEAIDNCANSADKECVCMYNLPVVTQSSALGDVWSAFVGGEYDVARLFGATMFAVAESEELSKWESRELSFERTRQGMRIGLNAMTLEEGAQNPTYAVGKQLVKDAWLNRVHPDLQGETPRSLLYAKDQAGESLDIFKERSGNISIYKQGAAPQQRQCEIHNKMLKFCIVQNQSVLSYDYDNNRMGMQQLVLKFAYLFRSKITDVKNFRVLDAKLTSNAILLVWDPVLGVDTEFYTLYYSPDPSVKTVIGSQAPKDVDVSSLGITRLELPTDEYSVTPADVKIESLLLPSWDFGAGERRYALETVISDVASAPLDPGVLYFSKDKKYFYFLPDMENDKDYFFAVTGTDSFGEESPSFNAPVEQKASVDDVPPSLGVIKNARVEGENLVIEVGPVTNIDGSVLDPSLFKGFTLYCFVDESNLDLSPPKRHFFAENQEDIEDGSKHLFISLRDINGPNCGTEQSPSSFMLVAAGRKQGAVEDYVGPISPAVLSATITTN